jgi:hypothetical protein
MHSFFDESDWQVGFSHRINHLSHHLPTRAISESHQTERETNENNSFDRRIIEFSPFEEHIPSLEVTPTWNSTGKLMYIEPFGVHQIK